MRQRCLPVCVWSLQPSQQTQTKGAVGMCSEESSLSSDNKDTRRRQRSPKQQPPHEASARPSRRGSGQCSGRGTGAGEPFLLCVFRTLTTRTSAYLLLVWCSCPFHVHCRVGSFPGASSEDQAKHWTLSISAALLCPLLPGPAPWSHCALGQA